MSGRHGGVRSSLVRTTALTSAVGFVVLGVLLGRQFARETSRHAVAEAYRTAELVTDLSVEPVLDRRSYAVALTDEQAGRLDRLTESAARQGSLYTLRVYGLRGRVRYDSRHVTDQRKVRVGAELRAAYEGRTAGDFTRAPEGDAGTGRGRLLEVYVPVRHNGEVVGAVELYLPYDRADAQVRATTRRVAALLVALLLLLWLLLCRVVVGASRALRRHAADSDHAARHDALTGLPNRRHLQDRLDTEIGAVTGRADRSPDDGGGRLGLLLLDLDRFKEINDTLGHASGDRLLVACGERIRGVLRDHDAVARLGGDEFAVLLRDADGDADVAAVARRVLEAFGEPFELDGLLLSVEPSIGGAVFPDDGADAAALLRRADIAMYLAKARHTGYAAYAAEDDLHSPERLALLSDLRRALDDPGQLQLHYQPKVDVRRDEVVGLEALLRWQHPVLGALPPASFIPLAERTGLIRPLTRVVLDLALAQVAAWRQDGLAVPVAVNLSARNLLEEDLPDAVFGALDRHGVDPWLLELEVTESAIIDDPARAETTLRTLADGGVRVSLDDFGTGYSSMSHLERLPLSCLKIDRSFVLGMLDNDNDAVIVRTVIDLAHDLGLSVVAEGVEDPAARRRLRELGCDVLQGYLLGRPVPPAEVVAVLGGLAAARV